MEKVYGVCGMECSECPAFIAYKTDDNELRATTAKQWSELYKADIKPENINCVGCMMPGEPKVSHCSQCEVRACGIKEKISTCAECKDYPCVTIKEYFKYVGPEAKANLESFRNK